MVSLCLRLIIILKIKVPVDMLVMHVFQNCAHVHVDLPSDFCYMNHVVGLLYVCCMQMPAPVCAHVHMHESA